MQQEERSYFKTNPLRELLKKLGLITFKDHLELISPLREKIAILEKDNQEFMGILNKTHKVLSKSISDVSEHSKFIVEQYDPARFVYESSSRSFNDKAEAVQYYEKMMKEEKPRGLQAEIVLYRKVTLRRAKAEHVSSK